MAGVLLTTLPCPKHSPALGSASHQPLVAIYTVLGIIAAFWGLHFVPDFVLSTLCGFLWNPQNRYYYPYFMIS